MGQGAAAPLLPPIQKSAPCGPPNVKVKWLRCAMSVLTSLLVCLAVSGADIEFGSNDKFYYSTFMRLRDTLFQWSVHTVSTQMTAVTSI